MTYECLVLHFILKCLERRAWCQAVLEDEKRVILALRKGVETQDYVAVKSLLQQAEVLGLSGEEVKQAHAMRVRIEVSFMWHRHHV